MKLYKVSIRVIVLCAIALGVLSFGGPSVATAQADDPSPPESPVKLIFIHHSCGENWLSDDSGSLGRALGDNNYFVSDTNYGWGPDSIGDRTDITDWPEWFRGPESARYMGAVYTESGQNSWYTRNMADPGGENSVVMFKSCFPNSALEGNPGDPPSPGGGLTVGNAKYIYSDLLNYFSTRPDKLFVVITAPPLIDSTYGTNARAFNSWLVNDWLAENSYSLNNVAIFDFHNVLTHPDNHHRYQNGQIEYTTSHGNGGLYYDSDGDDHPNPTGNQKAASEFVPLLNIYYHRWRAGAPVPPSVQTTQAPAPTEADAPSEPEPPQPGVASPPSDDLIDGFESGPPPGTYGWETFWDESTQTTIQCAPEGGIVYSGGAALHINFNIQANSWATCALIYDTPREWSSWEGLSFYVHASQPALVFDVNAYRDSQGDNATYLYTLETTAEMVDGWVRIELPWGQLLGADWEGNAGQPFDPAQAAGMAFGFGTYQDAANTGEVWVDDVRLIGDGDSGAAPQTGETPAAVDAQPSQPTPVSPDSPEEPQPKRGRLCGGSTALVLLALLGAVWSWRRSTLQ